MAERSRAPRRFARRGGIERRVRYARLLRYAIPHWPTIAGAVALTLLGSAMAGLQPWPLKLLVDHGLGNAPLPEPVRALLALFGSVSGGLAALGADPDRLPGFGVDPDRLALVVLAALATIAVYALGAAIDAWLAIAWSRAGQRMVYRLAGDVFLQLQRLSLRFHSRRPVGDSLSRVTGDSWTVYTLVDGLLLSPVKHLTVLSTVGFLAWQLDPRLTLLLLAAMPALAASALWFGGRLLRAERSRREALAALTAFVHQVLGALPAVQALGAAGRNSVVFGSLARDVVVATRSGALTRDGFAIVNGVATTIGVALVVYAGGSRVLEGALSLGSLLVFVAYARSLEVASRGLMRTWGELRGADAGIERVLEILEARDRVVDPARPQALPVRRAGTSGHVVFERVTFGYEPGRPVLRDLSLEVLQGETVALVGATGAGKTTLASLVPRFFDPWSGRVLLDGIDVRCVRLSALRGELGLVLQDPFILPLTVADNIAWGRPGASRSEIEAAAHAANADEFIRALPEGYDTAIGERGAGLSGGQRQRIAIARALLKDPRVLILDEPTSALDAGSETLVVDALSRVRRHRTTLIIAHRLSTIRAADRIVVLDGGRVAESGSHDDLLRRGGAYAAFCTLSALPGETSLRVPASQGRVPTRRSGPTR